jgi:cytochrome c-type biogenesis protein CcmH
MRRVGLSYRLARSLLVFALLTVIGGLGGTNAQGKTSVDAVAEGLTCQCGCGLTVANCNHPQCEFSVPVREQIEAMIARRRDRDQIIGFFRAKYGEKILSAPTTEGFNLLAWVVPFFLLLVNGTILLIILSRWRGQSTLSAPATAGDARNFDTELSELRRLLNDEIRKDA